MRAAVWLFVLAACQPSDPPKPAPVPPPPPAPVLAPVVARPAQLTHVTIKALGMDCEESCPIAVRSVLADVPGVYELGFDIDHEAIYMSYDSALGSAKEVTKPMIAAIKTVGFDPWLASETWPADAKVKVVPG